MTEIFLDPANVGHAADELRHVSDLAGTAAQSSLNLGFGECPPSVAADALATCREILAVTQGVRQHVGEYATDLDRRAALALAQEGQLGPFAQNPFDTNPLDAPPPPPGWWATHSTGSFVDGKWWKGGTGTVGYTKGSAPNEKTENGLTTETHWNLLAGATGDYKFFNFGKDDTYGSIKRAERKVGDPADDAGYHAELLNATGFAGFRAQGGGSATRGGYKMTADGTVEAGLDLEAQVGGHASKKGVEGELDLGGSFGAGVRGDVSVERPEGSVTLGGGVMYGVALEARGDASVNWNKLGGHFKIKGALGFGGELNVGGTVNPEEIAKDIGGGLKSAGQGIGNAAENAFDHLPHFGF